VVTACADEIPRAWLEQLVDGGRIELPLRLDPDGAAIQLIPVLERKGSRLRSLGVTWGGFMPLHAGDGGWRPPPAALTAGRSARGRHSSLVSISGAGLEQLSSAAARSLPAAVLTQSHSSVRQGITDLGSNRPPLLLLYLLLAIPASRRVSVVHDARLGVGIVHPRSGSLAVVSVRSPWRPGVGEGDRRARWRLDRYGGAAAASELEELLSEWQALREAGRTRLSIAAAGRGAALRLSFAWSNDHTD
jgi:hypothetical protein